MSAEPVPDLEPERPHLTLVETPAIKKRRPSKKHERAKKRRKPCDRCGGPKEKGNGRRTCSRCLRLKPCLRCGGPKEPGSARRLCEACRPQKVCTKCGGEKPPGKGRRLCEDCAELGRWLKVAKTRAKVAARRLPCRGCGAAKGPGRMHYCVTCQKARDVAVCRRCGGLKPKADGNLLCANCGPPIKRKKPCRECGGVKSPGHGKRYCDACMERHERQARARRAESGRMRARLMAEQLTGRHIDSIPIQRTKLNGFPLASNGTTDRLLDAAPMRAWLEQAQLLFADRKEMGRALDIDERILYEIGRQPRVTLGLADRAIWNLNRSLEVPGYETVERVQDLWPELA